MRSFLDILWIAVAVTIAIAVTCALGPTRDFYGAGGCMMYRYSPTAFVWWSGIAAFAARPAWRWLGEAGRLWQVVVGGIAIGFCALALSSLYCGLPYLLHVGLTIDGDLYFVPAAAAVGVDAALAISMSALLFRSANRAARPVAAETRHQQSIK